MLLGETLSGDPEGPVIVQRECSPRASYKHGASENQQYQE